MSLRYFAFAWGFGFVMAPRPGAIAPLPARRRRAAPPVERALMLVR
jgi:hypothetical protein